MNQYTFSVVIPAHNEEKYIGKCLRSIKSASKYVSGGVEMIVVANRCTDRTAVIAKHYGARVLTNAFLQYEIQESELQKAESSSQ